MKTDLTQNVLKTGTSLVGIVCKDGVVMAGDRRASAGGMVLSKNNPKVMQINDYVLISGTGLAADSQMSKKIIPAQLKLKELKDKKRPTVKEAASMASNLIYHNVRQPAMIPFQIGLLIGGFDEDGSASLFTADPAGHLNKVEDFDANFSSGMPFILGLLEKEYHESITVKEGIELAKDCIAAASQRDTASGNGLDVFTITKDGIEQVSKQKAESTYKEQ